jgi:hypothetical protein
MILKGTQQFKLKTNFKKIDKVCTAFNNSLVIFASSKEKGRFIIHLDRNGEEH